MHVHSTLQTNKRTYMHIHVYIARDTWMPSLENWGGGLKITITLALHVHVYILHMHVCIAPANGFIQLQFNLLLLLRHVFQYVLQRVRSFQ